MSDDTHHDREQSAWIQPPATLKEVVFKVMWPSPSASLKDQSAHEEWWEWELPAHMPVAHVSAILTFWRYHADKKEPTNPLFVWHAYRLARKAKVPVPEWVMDFFDGCSDRLIEEAGSAHSDKPRVWLPDAMGFMLKKGGKGSSALTQYRLTRRNLRIYSCWEATRNYMSWGDCPWCFLVWAQAGGGGTGKTPPWKQAECSFCAGKGTWTKLVRHPQTGKFCDPAGNPNTHHKLSKEKIASLLHDREFPLSPFADGSEPVSECRIIAIYNEVRKILEINLPNSTPPKRA